MTMMLVLYEAIIPSHQLMKQGGGAAVKLKGANHSESEMTLFKLSKTLHLVQRRRGEL